MKLKVSHIRFAVQLICFFLLLYGGIFFGWRRIVIRDTEPPLPVLSCHYNEKPILLCFLYDLQRLLATDPKRTLTYSISFLILAVLLGRIWCGWVCPLITIQDIFIRLRSLCAIPYISVSQKGKKVLRIFAYIFLFLATGFSFLLGRPFCPLYRFSIELELPFCQICPARQILPLLQGKREDFLYINRFSLLTQFLSYASISIFSVFIIGITFIRRFWCRVCPLGLLMSLLHVNLWSPFSLKKDINRCTRCGICARCCPMELDIVYEEKEKKNVLSKDCILCLRCVEQCPEDDALKFTLFGLPIMKSRFKP